MFPNEKPCCSRKIRQFRCGIWNLFVVSIINELVRVKGVGVRVRSGAPVEQLAIQKRELSERLDYLMEKSGEDSGVAQSLDVLRSHLQEFERGWSKLSVAQQKRLVKRTIVRLEVHPNMVGINFYLADGRLGFMPIDTEVRANNTSEFGISKNNIIPFKTKKSTASNLSVQFSRVVNCGDRVWT